MLGGGTSARSRFAAPATRGEAGRSVDQDSARPRCPPVAAGPHYSLAADPPNPAGGRRSRCATRGNHGRRSNGEPRPPTADDRQRGHSDRIHGRRPRTESTTVRKLVGALDAPAVRLMAMGGVTSPPTNGDRRPPTGARDWRPGSHRKSPDLPERSRRRGGRRVFVAKFVANCANPSRTQATPSPGMGLKRRDSAGLAATFNPKGRGFEPHRRH